MQDAKRNAKAKFKIRTAVRIKRSAKTKFKIRAALIMAATMQSNPIWGSLNLAKFRALPNAKFSPASR